MKHLAHKLGLTGTVLALFGGVVAWGGNELETAHKYYNSTNFEESLKVLDSIPQKDAAVYQLSGLNYYMRGEYKRAVEALEAALKSDPRNSVTTLWLARAYGRRAETSSPFTAMGFASRARQNFERAVELGPHNVEALSDLFEYYLDAPGFLGGGMEKAKATAGRIASLDRAEGEWAMSKLAEKQKQTHGVEAHLREAVRLAPARVGLRLELGRFLARQGRFAEAEESFTNAEAIAPGSPRILFAKAEMYVKYSRNLEVARQILQRYMSLSLTPDDPPRAEAAKLLRQAEGS